MDYEKAYKELETKAKSFIARWEGIEAINSELALKELKDMFNEFTESEDEKIRKELIYFFQNRRKQQEEDKYYQGVEILDRWISWLEKQGEQKPISKFKVGDRIYDKRDSYNRNVIREVGKDYYINAFGQKMDMAYTNANFEFLEHLEDDHIDSKPAEWSKEDEEICQGIINTLEGLYESASSDTVKALYAAKADWLKHLKPKPRPEWSEEDESVDTRFAFYTYKDEPNVLYLSNVFVEESSRNEGKGTEILKVAEQVAKSLNKTTIRLKVKKESEANEWYYKHGYSLIQCEDEYNWLEKKIEQKPIMIQWTGDNLKDVTEFTGYSPKFSEWFKNWEEYETYVHSHNNIFKMFNEDGSHYEVPVGAWIVKTPDGHNVASKATYIQKPASKVEPMFKVGDWIISDKAHEDYRICKIIEVGNGNYKIESIHGYCGYNEYKYFDNIYRLWTIEDAKPGDVLVDNHPFIFEKVDTSGHCYAYCGLNPFDEFMIESEGESGEWTWHPNVHPATNEQINLLFQKMEEAGYEWDSEKLKLVKIDQEEEDTPKFKVKKGEWYVCTNTFVLKGKIIAIKGQTYQSKQQDNTITCEDNCLFIDRHDGKASDYFRLWTIQDAKPGDILTDKDGCTFIFRELDADFDETMAMAYCGINSDGYFILCEKGRVWTDPEEVYPADSDDRNHLFDKMRDAGYEWDSTKLELKVVKQEPPVVKNENKERFERIVGFLRYKGFEDDADWLESSKFH